MTMSPPRALPGVLLPLLILLLLPSPLMEGQEITARPVSDEVAKDAISEFKKAVRNRDVTIRLAAVGRIGALQHEKIPTLLLTVARGDTSDRVRQAAAHLLSGQDMTVAAPLLRRSISAIMKMKDTEAASLLLEACYRAKLVLPLKTLTSGFDEHPKELQRGVVRLLRFVRSRDAVLWLAEHLEEPAPEWVDDPRNPPAEFWAEKQEKWRYWHDEVALSLETMTGQLFDTEKIVKEWVKKGGKIKPLDPETGTTPSTGK